jgi:D-glycero-D-manno-heptose 1,7-bisphosphate phosphatase
MTRSAVFLDRDGVLNRALVREGKPYAPGKVSDFEILPEAPEGCRRLKSAGFLLIVVTNQPEIARGTQRIETLEEMHALLRARLPVDDIRVCIHDEKDDCTCRKPRAGLLLDAAREWRIDLHQSFMVGDRWKDIDAGHAAGCRTVLIDRGYRESLRTTPDYRVDSLEEAVERILSLS